MSDFVKADQLIGSRYRLTVKDIDQLPYSGVSVWNAVDTTLKNSVRILVLDKQGEYFSEVLDAARRASLFDDAHVVKILVVGSDDEHGWVVTEVPLGFPVSYRLHDEAFPPEQAKSIVGETARVIASATSHGVRHLAVKPSDVRLDGHGQIFVDGLAVHAALAGIRTDTVMPYELDSKEAASLTRLYAQLLLGDDKTDPDVLIHNLCRDENVAPSLRYFFEKAERGAGALSASDLIRTFGSWLPIDVGALPVIPGMHMGDDADMDAELGVPREPALATAPRWPAAYRNNAQAVVASPSDSDQADVEEGDVESIESVEDVAAEDDVSAGGDASGSEVADEEAFGEEDTLGEDVTSGDDNVSEVDDASEDAHNASDTEDEPEPEADKASKDSKTAGTAGILRDKTFSSKVLETKNFLSAIAAKTTQTGKELSAKTASSISSVAGSPIVRNAMSSLEKQMDKVSEVPEDGGARRFNTAWLFTAISIGIVVLGGLVASAVFFSPPKVEVVNQGPTGPAITDEGDSSSKGDKSAASNSLVKSVELLNPQAGNLPTSEGVTQDNPTRVGNIADGDTSTIWESWWYPTADYTVGKNGLGLRITLKEAVAIDNIYVQVNGTGGNIQWLAGEPGANNKVIAEAPMSTATYLITDEPVTTDTVILWINKLPVDKMQKNRIVIAEIEFNKQISDTLRESTQSDESE